MPREDLPKFSMPEKIVGENVVLVPRTEAYDEALWQLIDKSRVFLRPYLFWVDGTCSVADVHKISLSFYKNFQEQNFFEYVFLDKQTKKLVGAGGAHTVLYNKRQAEFGYYRDVEASGKGYVSEAVSLLAKELFARGIHRLVIKCDVENIASAAVAKRCGFTCEGVAKDGIYVYGEYHDEYVFAKINGEKNNA